MFQQLPQLVDVRGSVKRNGSYQKRSLSQITGIARHHSATTSGDAFSFANYHVDTLGWPSVGYHFVITKDGTIQWANGIDRVSYHVGNNNTPLIGVCLVGSGSFTEAQERSFFDLQAALRGTDGVEVSISDVKGHREYPGHSSNTCPGIDMDIVREAVREGHPVGEDLTPTLRPGDNGPAVARMQQLLMDAGEKLPLYGADGDFGDETENAVRSFQESQNLTVDGIVGPNTWEALEASAVKGKLAVVLAEVLNVRSRPSFDADAVAGTVSQGEAFTIMEKVKVDGSSTEMFRLKSGLYITAHPGYVQVK
jgi:N-acetyl-anhydromuramyl-L-alanine amidase AmpD